ncbi:MAG: class I SAM-dependent methyltransferase [Gammaproteobacteria bacterium]|nr:class I SAM-dependent methyltransferase [Gammaproteobacteria bacterium]
MKVLEANVDDFLNKQAWDPNIVSLVSRAPLSLKEVDAALRRCKGAYVVSEQLGRFLVSAIQELEIQNVLEFGAGASSMVMGATLSVAGGGSITTVEQNPEWCSDTWRNVTELDKVKASMVTATPRVSFHAFGPCFGYQHLQSTIASYGPFDLVFIDAPQYYFGRDGTVPVAIGSLNLGSLLVLDDAGRWGERWALFRWLHTYPALRLVYYDPKFGGKGLAVLRYSAECGPRISLLSMVTSVRHTLKLITDPNDRRLRAVNSRVTNSIPD